MPVGRSVGRSVCHTLLFFREVAYSVACARLMAIGLVLFLTFSLLSPSFLLSLFLKKISFLLFFLYFILIIFLLLFTVNLHF